jgi:Helicase conserved C-terminal domain
VAELAQQLFTYQGSAPGERAKVLLVSATPYRMYTLAEEQADDNHYADFIRTAKFLFNSDAEVNALQAELRTYRTALSVGDASALPARRAVEDRLRRVMCRCERLGVTTDRNGMLMESPMQVADLTDREVHAYRAVEGIASKLEVHDTVEHWKSGSYLLNFMDEQYALKRRLRSAIDTDDPDVKKLLTGATGAHFPTEDLLAYREIDPGNAKLRALISAVVDNGAWKILWVPPCVPYYQAAGLFADPRLSNFTKTLVFSSWFLVPKTIAMLTSYAAERQAVRSGDDHVTYRDVKNRGNRLSITVSNERLTGLPVFTLLCPCVTLARAVDPLAYRSTPLLTAAEMLERVTDIVRAKLAPILADAPTHGPVDQSWYWAAPLLLDRDERPVCDWVNAAHDEWTWRGWEDYFDASFFDHVDALANVINGKWVPSGPPPDDLAVVLAKMALGSPATVALRSFLRRWPQSAGDLLGPASWIGVGFRTLFNLPESVLLLKGSSNEERYWERALEYGVEGNLQSVMDEYVHVLLESLALEPKEASSAQAIAEGVHDAVTLRTTTLDYDHFTPDATAPGGFAISKQSVRCRFAVRFGEGTPEEGSESTREDQVRAAFNSPFRPFVLASTSVGQEGLDFHHYCHSIWHWNLPSNPVDLEQREGRIHRFKGHVIRKNVAESCSAAANLETGDPWDRLFEDAVKHRSAGHSEMVPFWIHEGPHKILRHIPMHPLSRDHARYDDLIRTLALYRMVFGQPRQEDLLKLLQRQGMDATADMYRIDLSPRSEKQDS